MATDNFKCAAGAAGLICTVVVLILTRGGEQVAAAQGSTRDLPGRWSCTPWPLLARSDADVREVLRLSEAAGRSEADRVREVALESPDPLVVGNAIRTLVRLGVFARDDELLGLIHDPRLRVRQEAVLGIGSAGDARLASLLIPLLGDPEAGLRALAIKALGDLGGESAEVELRRVLEDPEASEVDRAFARSALRAAQEQ